MRTTLTRYVVLVSTITSLAEAIDLTVTNAASIRQAASTVAYGMVKYYNGNVTDTPDTVGLLPQPYYWWEAGAMWAALLDYSHYTGDTTYNDITAQALISQVGPTYNYMVPRQYNNEANDDQAFWGFAVMSAAEQNFPEPSTGSGGYSWAELVANLWNSQVVRWDDSTCGGGLRWQIFNRAGYDYKNSVSNGGFFLISARLARYTGNQTYLDWAEKSIEWSFDVGLIDRSYQVWDGASTEQNCTDPHTIDWTYNTGMYIYGCAVMYNITGASIWEERVQGLLTASSYFFKNNVMYEPACEPINTCDNDDYAFKGFLARWMWATSVMMPSTAPAINTYLQASAQGAAASCSGGTDGVTCGERWFTGKWDGSYGVGQQMSALEVIQGLLAHDAVPPIRNGAVPSVAPAPTTSTTSTKITTSTSSTTSVPKTTSTSTSSSPSAAPSSSDPPPTTSSPASPSTSTSSSSSSTPSTSSSSPTSSSTSSSTPAASSIVPSTQTKKNSASANQSQLAGLLTILAVVVMMYVV